MSAVVYDLTKDPRFKPVRMQLPAPKRWTCSCGACCGGGGSCLMCGAPAPRQWIALPRTREEAQAGFAKWLDDGGDG